MGSSGSGEPPRAEVAVVAPRSPMVEDGFDEIPVDALDYEGDFAILPEGIMRADQVVKTSDTPTMSSTA